MKIVAKHPEDIMVDDKATMQIYTAHAFEGEKGFLTISIADLNIASYFTGIDRLTLSSAGRFFGSAVTAGYKICNNTMFIQKNIEHLL